MKIAATFHSSSGRNIFERNSVNSSIFCFSEFSIKVSFYPVFPDCLPLAGVKAEEATGSESVTSYYVQSNFSGIKGNKEL